MSNVGGRASVVMVVTLANTPTRATSAATTARARDDAEAEPEAPQSPRRIDNGIWRVVAAGRCGERRTWRDLFGGDQDRRAGQGSAAIAVAQERTVGWVMSSGLVGREVVDLLGPAAPTRVGDGGHDSGHCLRDRVTDRVNERR